MTGIPWREGLSLALIGAGALFFLAGSIGVLRLPEDGPARSLFALCVSLLPGTLVANLGGPALLVHALDTGAPVATELAALEDAVAAMFSLELTRSEPDHA